MVALLLGTCLKTTVAMQPRISVHTSFTSVVALTMGCQFSCCAQSPLMQRRWTRLVHSGGIGVAPVTMFHRRAGRGRLMGRVERPYPYAGSPLVPQKTP